MIRRTQRSCANGRFTALSTTEMATHSFDPENPHPASGGVAPTRETSAIPMNGAAATAEFEAVMDTMHQPMMEGIMDPDPDVAFIRGMIPHHQGAIDMARVQLKYVNDLESRALAEHIISEQEQEIAQMNRWLEMREQAASQ